MPQYDLNINGSRQTVDAEPDMPLLWVLRDILGLTGAKYGCGIGACRSCTVLVGDTATPSCQLPVSAIGDSPITTIEGLSEEANHPLQIAWDDLNVAQCGYCQAGQIMTAAGWLKTNAIPSREDIEQLQSPNLCRCGTYPRIVDAIEKAVENMG